MVLPEKEMLENISHLKEHHKDADSEQLTLYVERMMTHEKVLHFLETEK